MNAKTAELARLIENMTPNTTVLDLRGYGLETLPESIGTLTHLTKLDLNGNRLTSLPESIGNLTNLTELYLNGHKLTALPQSIGNLTNLTRLDLNGDRLESLPDSIANLTKLTELNLNGNRFDRFPDILFSLPNLKKINLDGNPLIDLSNLKLIHNLKICRSYTSSKFKIFILKNSVRISAGDRYLVKGILPLLKNFVNLVLLNLNGYGMSILENGDVYQSLSPEATAKILMDISKLPKISSIIWHINLFPYFSIIELISSLNSISFLGIHLPYFRLRHLASIDYLYLTANMWTDLSVLHNFPKLRIVYFYFVHKNNWLGLNLSRRYWTKFSNWKLEWLLDETDRKIREFIVDNNGFNLESLIGCIVSNRLSVANLSNLNLEKLTDRIGDAISLNELNLSGNNLTELPEKTFNIVNLKQLNLSSNSLLELPDSIGRLKRLVKVDLSRNQIVNISDEVEKLSEVMFMDLSFNNLQSIPYTIDGLLKIKNLNLNENKLKILPNSIGDLEYLENLDLGNNQLTTLPERIGNLRRLTTITLNNNPITDLSILNKIDSLKQVLFGSVSLPRRYWTNFSEWNPKWLLDETNTEIRRLLIKEIGYEKICIVLKAVKIDAWREYTLLKINNFQPTHRNRWGSIVREPIVLLKMTCPSTGHIHILRVPPDMTSAEDAIVWVNHGIHPDRFAIQT